MARRIRRPSADHKRINSPWTRLGLSVTFIVLAYGVASWAIDSGSLLQYALCLVLVYWALAHAVRGLRYAFVRYK